MKANHSTQLAAQIRDKLANQGFLSSQDLSPFLCQAIKDAVYQKEPKLNGILVDGFPRCMEQLDSWTEWPFQNELPLVPGREGGGIEGNAKPDVVLLFNVTKENARSRYLSRARDNNDSAEKFERRFVEYEEETLEVVEEYRKRGILIEVSFRDVCWVGNHCADLCRLMRMGRKRRMLRGWGRKWKRVGCGRRCLRREMEERGFWCEESCY